MREKAPGDWVSAADLASEDAVRAVLERETGPARCSARRRAATRADTGWLVDPLDGTANFVHGLDAVGVSVGLVADGEPVVGVVHAPLLDRTYRGAQGGGAFRDERRIHVSDPPPGAGDRRHRVPVPAQGPAARYEPRVHRRVAPLRGHPPGRRRPASTSAGPPKACSTATSSCGSARGTSPPAAIIVREAGGVVTDWDGDARRLAPESGNILAGPPDVHAVLLDDRLIRDLSRRPIEIRETPGQKIV